MPSHTILLVQPGGQSSRTFFDYPTVAQAINCEA
jgi:hypothetical protein